MFSTQIEKSWVISLILHIILISIFSIQWTKQLPNKELLIVPVKLAVIKESPKPKVKPVPVRKPVQKKQPAISKIPVPEAKVVEKPTSLPGDRSEPEIVEKLTPVYPKKALNNDWEGVVKVEVIITETGKIKSIKLLDSSGFDVLDQAFIRTINQYYLFKPKRTMGENIESSIIVSHTFKIGDTP